ncbi:MAG: DUF357 domain-containing protein [Nanoarchaeota archaeon]
MEDLNNKLKRYFKITKKALNKIKINAELDLTLKKSAEDILDLAKRYYEDAEYFDKKGDKVNAFGAVVYSHAFLDIGARLSLFDVDDDELFMVEK